MPLAEPYEGMTPDEKGELMLRYVDSGQTIERLAFSEVSLVGAELAGADLARGCLDRADLSGADLSGADLSDAALSGAVLWRADLSGARLHRAILRRATLDGADLSGADLSGADLVGADLRRVCLDGADLSGAGLHRARLEGCSLRGADLQGADLQGADLQGTELRLAGALGGCCVDHEAAVTSGWAPELIAELVSRGVRAIELSELLQRAVEPGLTLYLSAPQGPGAQGALQVFASEVSGWEGDVRLSEIAAQSARIRLLSADPGALIVLAERLASSSPWSLGAGGLSDRLQRLQGTLDGQILVARGIHLRLDRSGWCVIRGAPGGVVGPTDAEGVRQLLAALGG